MEQQKLFNLYSNYYNLFYADKSYEIETSYIDTLIQKFSPDATSILEYGSGTGGHGLLLKQKGYKIMGIERSEEMAKIARAKGYDCHVGDIVTYEVKGIFDVCIALFHVVSYINSNDQLIRLFTKTKANLRKGGLFIFDVWFTPAVLSQVPEVRVKRVEDHAVSVTRIAEPVIDFLNNIVEVKYDVQVKSKTDGSHATFSESHSMRHFGYPEIQFLATLTGFDILKAEEFVTGSMPGSNTWGVNFILKAK
jgi:SAM-dependent methyltransferase